MQKTKTEIINETAEFYGADPTRRAILFTAQGGHSICAYLTEEGKKCAVGRYLIERKKISNHGNGQKVCAKDLTCAVTSIEDLDQYLLPEYRGHEIDFWMKLQSFHDTDKYFSEKSLSEKGVAIKEYLLSVYKEEQTEKQGGKNEQTSNLAD